MSFKTILHPTDFSEQSMVAFAHALKLALEEKARFIIMYVQEGDSTVLEWEKFPKVRDTLNKWGMVEADVKRKDIYEKLGVDIQKVIGKGENIKDSVAGIVHEEKVDLIVLSTHGREGFPGWFKSSISESIARQSLVPTLFIPYGSRPFVNPKNGQLTLNTILIPVDHKPKPQAAVEFGINMGNIYGEGKSQISIMHVVDKHLNPEEDEIPEIKIPENEDCIVRTEVKNSSIVEEISRVADEINANLIVIPTEGRNGFLDAVFGSTSEQVLRHSDCPTLSIPVSYGKFIPRFDEDLKSNK